MKTTTIKKSEIQHDWWIADADGQILGRFASRIAQLLRGKHKPHFTPHMDMGDCVVVINAEKIRVSGTKEEQKEYFRHFYKVNFLIILLFVIYIIVQNLSYHFLPFDWGFLLHSIVIWILFLIYLTIHFFQLSTAKFSPTLVNFLKRELSNVVFEIK